jgi:hypothetical protein
MKLLNRKPFIVLLLVGMVIYYTGAYLKFSTPPSEISTPLMLIGGGFIVLAGFTLFKKK